MHSTNDYVEALLKAEKTSFLDRLSKSEKIVTRNGVQYYASGKHAGKIVGTVRRNRAYLNALTNSVPQSVTEIPAVQAEIKYAATDDLSGDVKRFVSEQEATAYHTEAFKPLLEAIQEAAVYVKTQIASYPTGWDVNTITNHYRAALNEYVAYGARIKLPVIEHVIYKFKTGLK